MRYFFDLFLLKQSVYIGAITIVMHAGGTSNAIVYKKFIAFAINSPNAATTSKAI